MMGSATRLRRLVVCLGLASFVWLVAAYAGNGSLFPAALLAVALAAMGIVAVGRYRPTLATVGRPAPVVEHYETHQITWAGDPGLPGKPRPRAPGR